MADIVWGAGSGAGADGLYSTAANWTGDGKPGAGDIVMFDGDIFNGNIRLDEGINALGMAFQGTVPYSGIIDAGTDDLSHALGASGLDCTNAGAATLNNDRADWGTPGDWDLEDMGTWTTHASAATLTLTGTGKIWEGIDGMAVTITGSYTTSTVFSAGSVTIPFGATLTISAGCCEIEAGAWIVAGTLTGAGEALIGNGATATNNAVLWDVAITHTEKSATIASGTGIYESALFSTTSGGGVRTMTIADDLHITGDWVINATTLTIDNSANPNIIVEGDLTIAGTVTWTKGTGTITFSGGNNQDVDFNGETLEDIIIDKTAGDLVLTGPVSTESFLGTSIGSGDFDPGGQNITTVAAGDFTLGENMQISTPANLNGATWTVAGDFLVAGGVGDLLDLKGAAAWNVAITGRARALYVDVSNCDASGGVPVDATDGTSTDSGSNTSWRFPATLMIQEGKTIGGLD